MRKKAKLAPGYKNVYHQLRMSRTMPAVTPVDLAAQERSIIAAAEAKRARKAAKLKGGA